MESDTEPLLRTLSGDSSSQSLVSLPGCKELDHAEELQLFKKPKMTRHLAFGVAACVLGSSFQVGYNGAVVNSPAEAIQDFYNKTYFQRSGNEMPSSLMTLLWGITVSSYCAGGMVGGLSAGFWANRYGRRGALLRNNIVALVAAALLGLAKMAGSYEMFIIGRIVAGLNAGVSSGVAPLYLSEISPVVLRGLCGTFNQIAICFGVLVSQVLGLSVLLGTEELWPIVVGFPVVPVVYQLVTLTCCPETPRYLMVMKHEEDEAEKSLIWFRNTEDIDEELEEMRREVVEQRNTVKFSVSSLFVDPLLRWPLIICVVLQLAQQLSGINAVIYYSTLVFEDAGLSQAVAQYATAATGAVNVGWTFVSAVLIDRLGRRTLMITGLSGMFIFTVVLTVTLIFQASTPWLSYLCIAAVVMYIVAFATGPGAIPWFYVTELFAQGPRSTAVSISVLVNWLANFAVGLLFPELHDALNEYSFVPFAALLLLFVLFVFFYVPETKGKRIEDITMEFKASIQNSESLSTVDSRTDLSYQNIRDESYNIQRSS